MSSDMPLVRFPVDLYFSDQTPLWEEMLQRPSQRDARTSVPFLLPQRQISLLQHRSQWVFSFVLHLWFFAVSVCRIKKADWQRQGAVSPLLNG
jgi:hypothetical protein